MSVAVVILPAALMSASWSADAATGVKRSGGR